MTRRSRYVVGRHGWAARIPRSGGKKSQASTTKSPSGTTLQASLTISFRQRPVASPASRFPLWATLILRSGKPKESPAGAGLEFRLWRSSNPTSPNLQDQVPKRGPEGRRTATAASAGEARCPGGAAAEQSARGDEGTTASSPPPSGAQIGPAMDPVRSVNRHSLVRINCRIRVVSWWIVGSSRNISNARITHHQFPTARIPRWKRLAGRECHRIEGGTRLCAGRRSVAHHCRGHSQSQSQSQPLHLSLSIYHPGKH